MSKLFPELDTPQPAAPADSPVRAPEPAATDAKGPGGSSQAPAGAGATAGAKATAHFDKLLRLGNRLSSVRLQDGRQIVLDIDLSPLEPVRLQIGPRGAPAWIEAQGFAIRYAGKAPHPAIERLMRQFVFRHALVPLDALCALVVPDAEDAGMLPWDDPSSLFYSYGAGAAWRTFFEGRELYRGVCERFEGNVVELTHNEIECHYNYVPRTSKALSFFNHVSTAREEDSPGGPRAMHLMTDLSDLDVIKGGDVKLDQALDSIATLEQPPQMVLVGSTCVPIVTGDDLEASAARASKKLGLPVIVTGNQNNPQELLLSQMLNNAMAAPVETRKGSINLIGMPRIDGWDDLASLLAKSGISLNASVLPGLDPISFRRFGAAELFVRYPWDRYRSGADTIGRHFQIPTITPPAPFGMEGSRRWLLAIADALGRREEAERAWEVHCAEIARPWADLCAKARAYHVGFVLPNERWREMLSAQRCMGVPMCDVLEEMGFGIDLFVYTARPAPKPPDTQSWRIFKYQSAAELEEMTRASPAVAFYSEMYFDRRLTRNGKNSFSLKDFQLGPRGAVASLKRLLAVCKLPFYRTYGSLLGKPFALTGEKA